MSIPGRLHKPAKISVIGVSDPESKENEIQMENLNSISSHNLGEAKENAHVKDLEAVYDIVVTLSVVLGKATMQISQLLKLGRGAVVEIDRRLGDAIDIYVNNRLVARGEVGMVDESRLGVTMTEIVKSDRQ